MMALVDAGVVATQPDAADRKAAISPALRNARFLKQRQGAPARSNKDELGRHRSPLTALSILDLDAPASVFLAVYICDAVSIMDNKAWKGTEMINKMIGQRSVVDIRARDDARRSHRLVIRASFHHQGSPIGDLLLVLGIFHAAIAMVGRHCLKSLSEERYILGAPDEAHVGNWVDESPRILDRALLHYVRPELARQIEFDIDLQRSGYVDTAVGTLGRVVQLTIGSVAGAGVVPGVRALKPRPFKRFEHFDVERWLELLEKHANRRAHDAGADENDIWFGVECVGHGSTPCSVGRECSLYLMRAARSG